MKKVVIMVCCMVVSMASFAQESLMWGNIAANPIVDPTGAQVVYSETDTSIGALVQLIYTSSGSISSPTWSTNGLSGDNELVVWSCVGYGSGMAAIAMSDTLANYGLGTSSSVFVRVWATPTSGSGNVPAAFDYGSGLVGAYYYDTSVSLISSLPKMSDFYVLDTGDIGAGSWTFLAAVPEPGSMALGLLGLGVILIRRRMARK